jgi:hypothetical protein
VADLPIVSDFGTADALGAVELVPTAAIFAEAATSVPAGGTVEKGVDGTIAAKGPDGDSRYLEPPAAPPIEPPT